MKPDLVIGVDCSTTSCKAIVWDAAGQKIAEGRSPLTILTPHPLWHEQPAETWWQAAVVALREALQFVNPDRLAAICVAHQRETFVPVDEAGVPLRPAILWMDARAETQFADLGESFGRTRFHHLTGKPLSGNLSAAKIAWLQENEPEIFARTYKYLDVHAFLVHQLTGLYATGWGCADPMGVFDMTQNQWAADLLASLGLSPDQFPAAWPPGEVIGAVTAAAAQASGLPAGLPLVAGIGDGQAAGLGSRVIDASTAYLSLGTSVVAGYFAETYQTSVQFRTMYGGIPHTYFLETVILGGAYTVSWLLDQLLDGRQPRAILERAAQEIPAGSQGLLVVPYWQSAMNPYWDAQASGMMIGLRSLHGAGHIYRAVLEGIAFEQRLHTQGVAAALGREVEKFVVVGGGANSDLWCQILADITGKRVQRALEREATALGAGILAAAAVQIYPDPRKAAQAMVHLEGAVFDPDEKRHQHYSQLYETVYRQIYPALRGQLHALADLSNMVVS